MKWMWVFVFILPGVLATGVDIEYQLGDTTQVTYDFFDVDTPLTFTLPEDANQVNKTVSINESQLVIFTSNQYTTRDIFSVDLSSLDAEIREVRVYLPEQVTLTRSIQSSNPSVTPTPTDVFSDGRSIILLWQQEDIEPARAIIVEYDRQASYTGILFFAGLMLLGLGLYLIGKRTPSTDYTKNLFEEEKRIVEILLEQKDHEMWQNALTKEAQMSKVQVSRKLKNLQKKGLIEKIPHGNTNKIRLLQRE